MPDCSGCGRPWPETVLCPECVMQRRSGRRRKRERSFDVVDGEERLGRNLSRLRAAQLIVRRGVGRIVPAEPPSRPCRVYRLQVTALVEMMSEAGVVEVVKGVLGSLPGFDIVEVRSLD